MKIELNYGKGKIPVEVNDSRVKTVLRKSPAEVIADPKSSLLAALENPIGAMPLKNFCAPGKSACVVVSDLTRPVPNHIILPVLLGYLESNGVRRNDVTILIATGMHRAVGHDELVDLLGPEVVRDYLVVNHKPESEEMLDHLGFTSHGSSIKVNKFYTRSDLKVLTGLIEPHFMAGYSGGRKSICPGIAGFESMVFSHGVECLGNPASANCVLAGNPFHEEALEVALAAGCDFIVNAVIDEERRITGIFAGDLIQAHEAGCAFVDKHFKTKIAEAAEIALTTNAGFPLDVDFYQSVKGLIGALPAIKPGGTIIIASRCPEGLGSEQFVDLLRELKASKSPEDFLDHHREYFVTNQWEVQKLLQVLAKASFMIFSEGLTKADAELAQGTKLDSIEQGLELAFAQHGGQAKAIIIPEGPYVVPEAP
jgi:nickel-dependent lactate racemase